METRMLKALSALNLIPFALMLTWCAFVIVIYANPGVPSMVFSAGFLGNDRGTFQFFETYDRFMLICNALRIIAFIFMFFQLVSLVIGLICAKKPQCVKIWRVLCIINTILCLISTNIISAGITGYIFARLSNIKVDSDSKSGIIWQ